jgi:hypothetical protein
VFFLANTLPGTKTDTRTDSNERWQPNIMELIFVQSQKFKVSIHLRCGTRGPLVCLRSVVSPPPLFVVPLIIMLYLNHSFGNSSYWMLRQPDVADTMLLETYERCPSTRCNLKVESVHRSVSSTQVSSPLQSPPPIDLYLLCSGPSPP